jgi:hypothetical protein
MTLVGGSCVSSVASRSGSACDLPIVRNQSPTLAALFAIQHRPRSPISRADARGDHLNIDISVVVMLASGTRIQVVGIAEDGNMGEFLRSQF